MASSWDTTPAAPSRGQTAGSSWDRTQSTPIKPVPFEDPGFMQSVLIGAGRTFDQIGKGARQVYYGITGNAEAQRKLAEEAAYEDSLYKPLQEHRPFATGTGEALPGMILAGAGGTTLGANVLRQSLASAAPAALSYGSLGDRLQNAGWQATAGAALPLIGAAGKTAYAAAEPFMKLGQEKIIGRLLNSVAGDDAAVVTARLRAAAPVVKGSLPTAAQVAENGGIAALERSASAVNPQAYAARQVDQSLARKAALQKIAGTPQQMADALLARDTAVAPMYGSAKNANYVIDTTLDNLLQRPMVNDAMVQAKSLAENQGRTFAFKVDPSNPYSGLGITGNPNTYVNGHGLQDLKMAMDGMLSDPTGGFAGAQGATLRNLRGQVIDWMEGANPAFKEARTTYSDMSRPINQMQIGQSLYEKLSPALSDFGALGKDTPGRYAQALREAEQTAKQATGFPGATLADVMTPDQMGILNGVGTDLARVANAQNLGRGVGSDTVQKLGMQNIATQSGMPTVMGLVTKIGSHPLGWVYDDVNREMARKLADTLLSPSMAADMMDNAVPTLMQNSPQARALLANTLMRTSALTGPAGAAAQQVLTPALTAE